MRTEKIWSIVPVFVAFLAAVSCGNGQQTSECAPKAVVSLTFGNPAPDGTAPVWNAGDEVWISDGEVSTTLTVSDPGSASFTFPGLPDWKVPFFMLFFPPMLLLE